MKMLKRDEFAAYKTHAILFINSVQGDNVSVNSVAVNALKHYDEMEFRSYSEAVISIKNIEEKLSIIEPIGNYSDVLFNLINNIHAHVCSKIQKKADFTFDCLNTDTEIISLTADELPSVLRLIADTNKQYIFVIKDEQLVYYEYYDKVNRDYIKDSIEEIICEKFGVMPYDENEIGKMREENENFAKTIDLIDEIADYFEDTKNDRECEYETMQTAIASVLAEHNICY